MILMDEISKLHNKIVREIERPHVINDRSYRRRRSRHSTDTRAHREL